MEKDFPTGVKDFKALVTGNYYFVDKTMMIKDVCNAVDRTFLYTRPRRFGKSINLSMLDYFFNMKYKDDEDIFEGLKISGCQQCDEHKSAYPVIRMNFGKLNSTSVEMFGQSLIEVIKDIADSFAYLAESEKIGNAYADLIKRAQTGDLNKSEALGFISRLCKVLCDVYGKDTIILVDEYDQCIQNIHSATLFEQIVGELKPFMEQTFKFNDHIRFGVVTGIMPLAKTSMLSSFNNATVCSILETKGDEYFGFTEEEVIDLLKETGNPSDKIGEIREWYDGYHFGDADVYNPYSVIMYLDNGCSIQSYWSGMTGAGMSSDLVSSLDPRSLSILKALREGSVSYIESPINNKIVYADVISSDADPSIVYSYLAMCGYLNVKRTGKIDGVLPVCEVSMVNKEVAGAFDILVKRATELEGYSSSAMDAIYEGDASKTSSNLMLMLSGIAMDGTWVMKDNSTARHNRYRDMIMAYLVTPKIFAKEEVRKGLGIADIFIPPIAGHPAVIIEVKTTIDDDKDLVSLSQEALAQIVRKRYADEPGSEDAICVGIGIRMKTVEVTFG